MKINIKRLTETAILPERGSAYAAGYDLFADVNESVEIQPHETKMIGTGLAMEIPEGYFGEFLQEAVFLLRKDFARQTAWVL